MQSLMNMIARYTGGADAEVALSADKQRNLLISQGNPTYNEVRRRGDGWTVMISAASEGVAALPTSLAHLELYNNGVRLAVVSDLHLYRVLGSTVVESCQLFAQISTQKAVPTLAALTLYSLSGKAFVVPTVTSEMVTGVDTGVIANGWQPYGLPLARGLEAATPGAGWSVEINGKLCIPPGCSLCLTVCASTAEAAAFHIGATFDWVTATLEA